jgi:hypothetical protein
MSASCFKTSPPHVGEADRDNEYETLYAELAHVIQRHWFTALAWSAASGIMDDFSGSITPSEERVGGFRCWKLSHVAFIVNRLVLPERNKAAAR